MKKLTGLQVKILGFDQKPLKLAMDSDDDLTIAAMLVHYLGTFTSDNGDKSILARKIGQKVYDHKERSEIIFEDAEWDLVKEAVKKPQHSALAFGPFKEHLDKSISNEVPEANEVDISETDAPG